MFSDHSFLGTPNVDSEVQTKNNSESTSNLLVNKKQYLQSLLKEFAKQLLYYRNLEKLLLTKHDKIYHLLGIEGKIKQTKGNIFLIKKAIMETKEGGTMEINKYLEPGKKPGLEIRHPEISPVSDKLSQLNEKISPDNHFRPHIVHSEQRRTDKPRKIA